MYFSFSDFKMERTHTLRHHQGYVSKSIQLASIHHSLSLKWDSKQSRVLIGTQAETKNIKQKGLILRVIIITLTGIGFIYSNQQSNFEIAVLCYQLVMLYASLALMQVFNGQASLVCQYINGHLSFTAQPSCSNLQKVCSSVISKIGLVYAYSLFPLPFCVGVFCAYGIHIYNPCKTTLLGYWMLPECHFRNFNVLLNSSIKIGVFLSNHLIWSYTFSCIPIEIGVVLLLGSMSFSENLQR